jgi:hypothetical protein
MKRKANDLYETPLDPIFSLISAVGSEIKDCKAILEPSAGSGNIVRAFAELNWTAVELEAQHKPKLTETGKEVVCPQDFLTWEPTLRWDLVLGNPPFSLAKQFIEKSLTLSPKVILLLRLAITESQARKSFWQEQETNGTLPELLILAKRPSFTGGPTDSTAYCWVYWGSPRPGTWRVI